MTFFTNLKEKITGEKIPKLIGKKEQEGAVSSIHYYPIASIGSSGRIHLRINTDGSGVLMINANQIFHLNPTAALMAFYILEKKQDNEIKKIINKKFNIDNRDVLTDIAMIRAQIDQISSVDTFCPVHDLDIQTLAPFSKLPDAPYRMDLAITYRCNNNCSHCYNARSREFPELSTQQWFTIIDKTWEVGIPHIIFTGGEPTLRNDLPELIRYANNKGQITGINTNGRRMSDSNYVKTLVDAGLDHVQITIESVFPEIHDEMVDSRAFFQTTAGIKNCVASSLYLMTNTTMLMNNIDSIPETIDYLAEIGVKTIGLNSLIHAGKGSTVGTGLHVNNLTSILELARQKTDFNGQRLIWYTPTQYCGFDPQSLDLGVKGCTAALYNMCIEPNGDVLPCQSYYKALGNILLNDWSSVWNHPLSVNLRERKGIPEKCGSCNMLAECGGGCPLQFEIMDETLKGKIYV